MSAKYHDPFDERSSGILLHPTSLPGPHGVGDLGPAAYEFVDFLKAAGQRWWQMLPVGPPGAGNSPYDSSSAFAGSPLLIGLHDLAEQGLLGKSDLKAPKKLSEATTAAYQETIRFKDARLRSAYDGFEADASSEQRAEFESFKATAASWLDSYSLFTALKHHTNQQAWFQWPSELRSRKTSALKRVRQELAGEIEYCCFQQFQFDRQWRGLRAHCARNGIRLLGDVPMFVAHDGADVWEHQQLFFLDEEGQRTFMAGVPPDYFSEDGQLWGNPLYRWSVLQQNGYAWWIARLEQTLERFDALRLDHFIAFHRYWEIPGGATSAKQGRFVKVPGKDFFKKVRKKLGGLPFVAEDLGLITPKVQELRDQFELPGMRVLQFGFSAGAEVYQPHRYPPRAIAYTGTHDNDTLVGWLDAKPNDSAAEPAWQAERERALSYVGSGKNAKDRHWSMIRALMMSVANTTIFPLQDVLGLDTSARMNVPGTPTGNWTWRVSPDQLGATVAKRMRTLSELYERLPK